MLQKSQTIGLITKALSNLQGELVDATKNAVNPHFKSGYADLSEVLGNIRPLLAKNGLALSQFPSFENGICSVTSLLSHESGEWLESVASAPVDKVNVQGVGSAITYLKRYSAAAIVGMASADADDDGNSVSNLPPQKVEVKQAIAKTEWTAEEKATFTAAITAYAKAWREAKMPETSLKQRVETYEAQVNKAKPSDVVADINRKTQGLSATVQKSSTADIPF